MKYFLIALLMITIASCRKSAKIEFNGIAPGIKSGTFIIKTTRDSTVFGTNITDGRFKVQGTLSKEGYYTMDIVNDADANSHGVHFEVYLEGGSYAIKTDAGKPYNYPEITSASAIQKDLSAYYAIADQQMGDLNKEIAVLNAKMDSIKKASPKNEMNSGDLGARLYDAREKQDGLRLTALKDFVKQNPQSALSAHLMADMDYEDKPVEYYEVYKMFGAEAKASSDGKEIGARLGKLVKLVPGAQSPDIIGKTPDGKTFDKSSVKKKVILLDFWRASDPISRTDHQEMLTLLAGDMKGKNWFGIVSVDFDSKPDWWTTAIRDDHMSWTQVSDLRGDDSPNATNWAISRIPTYYLVDGNWKIIERDITLAEVPGLADKYLKQH
ncbi:MAG TPA: hypothetical protein VHB54_20255 [Mucilaginibacter sp.]|nr:hypothetical protein [Mucilaginibacter sp.]